METLFLLGKDSHLSQLIAGLFDEARIHLTGLKRMVELRGGITDESIRSASMLSAIITYVDRDRLT